MITISNLKNQYESICYFGDDLADHKAAKIALVPFVGILNDENKQWFTEENIFWTTDFEAERILKYLELAWNKR